MIITDKMKEHLVDPEIIKEKHIDEYNTALAGRETLHEILEKGDKSVIYFDTGFLVFNIDNDMAVIDAYYRSKESSRPIKRIWDAMVDMWKENGCNKVIAHAMNKRTMSIFKYKYGFKSLGWDNRHYRYDMEMAI